MSGPVVTVLYPTHESAKFDLAYYVATHTPLVEEVWAPERVELVAGTDGPDGAPAPYAMIAQFRFASPEAFGTAMGHARGPELMADIANFTDITPQLSIGRAAG